MLTMQFGQCGNQLGETLFSKITDDLQRVSPGTSFSDCYEYKEDVISKWFEGNAKDGRKIARVILIDTEKKVINRVVSNKNDYYCYRSKNIITPGNSGGSANNWAFGYSRKGPLFNDLVLEAVRREVERTDRLDGFLCLLSCAGGTGSGLGSFIISSLRNEFPVKNIITAPVLPFSSGEVATQNYNTILSLAKIIGDSDLIIMMENEKLDQQLSSNNFGVKIDFPKDLNAIAAENFLSIFQPARDVNSGCRNQINHIISKVSPHPGYKLASIETIPPHLDSQNASTSFQKNSNNYQIHYKSLRKELSLPRGIRSLCNILITRGTIKQSKKKTFCPDDDDPNSIHQLIDREIYSQTKWLSFDERMTHFHQKRNFLGNKKYSSVISNNSRIAKTLDEILASTWKIYTHGAFLHQYKQYGLEEDDFLRAFAKIESVIKSYKSLEVN